MRCRRALALLALIAGTLGGGPSAADAPSRDGAEAWLAPWRAAMLAAQADARLGAVQARRRALDLSALFGAPVLAAWITESHAALAASDVRALPPALHDQLVGFFPAVLLQKVRYRVGWPDGSPPSADAFRLLDARAITLVDIIVFRDQRIADDPAIWAHELTHVQQYAKLGVPGFAERYIRDRDGIESEAWDAAAAFTMWAIQAGRL